MAQSIERRQQLAEIERRSWQLWALSLAITGLLTLALAVLFYPSLKWGVYRIETRHLQILPQLVSGLLVLVFLSGVYVIWKQRELNIIRNFIVNAYVEAALLTSEYPHDPLTGVLDRRALPDILKREGSRADRLRSPLTLLLFDIRGFRKINEEEGNHLGDLMLKDLAQTLRSTLRQPDAVMRYGADQFLCLLPDTSPTGGVVVTRRVAKTCERVARLQKLRVDFGIATYLTGRDLGTVVAEAELDLKAKRTPPAVEASPQAAPSRI